MLHNTAGIVLRNIKYGETSVVATIFTELFGVQSYLINGIRVSSPKSAPRAGMLQPACILEMVVYHNELKNLQRVKEFKWKFLYQHIYFDVKKNAVALFMVELLTRCLKQPEAQPDLFHFCEDALENLDRSDESVTANFPLYFILHLAHFFGFRMNDNYSPRNLILDLTEGNFVAERPTHQYYLESNLSETSSQILKVMQPSELAQIKLNRETRKQLLQAYVHYYMLHLSGFGVLRSLPVLHEIF